MYVMDERHDEVFRNPGSCRHHAEVVFGDVNLPEGHRANGPVRDGNFVRLAGPVVGDRESVLGHISSFATEVAPHRVRYRGWKLPTQPVPDSSAWQE